MTQLADRYQVIADPTVMKVLELSSRPGIISLAGGLPSSETFPIDLVADAERTSHSLQYSSAQGSLSFRQVLAERFTADWGREVTQENILITSGSQQAIDLIGRTFLNSGDTVLTEDPTYFVAIYAFSAYAPKYKAVDWKKPKSLSGAKLAYVVPTFANPTGNTLTQIERQVIGEMFKQGETILIEDDPYSQLYFGRRPPRPITAAQTRNVVYITSLSKIVGPALRLGIVVAEESLIAALTRVKTGMDLCTSALTQSIAEQVLSDPRFDVHLERIRKYYGRKARIMLGALKKNMPARVTWSRPQGGMFVWVTLPEQIDTAELYEQALVANVAFVPGYIFRPAREQSSSLRLSFATASPEEINQGIKILAQLIGKEVRKYV